MSFKVGKSNAQDPQTAIDELAESVLEDSALVLIYCTNHYPLPALARLINEKFADTRVIGCTTAGCVGPGGYMEQGVVACGLGNDHFQVALGLLPDLDQLSYEQVDAAVETMRGELEMQHGGPVPTEQQFAFLLIDGLCKSEESVTQSLHLALRNVPLIGGSAGDGLRFESTAVFYQGRFHKNAAVVALIFTDLPFKPFQIQHFEPSERRMVVTDSIPARRIVTELNGLPAAVEYARNVGLTAEELSPMVFAAHPVMVKIGDEIYIRSIQKVNDDGSITFFCAIDNGVVLGVARAENLLENLRQSLQRLGEAVGGTSLILGCDCILRYLEIEQKGWVEEASRILNDNHLFGFSTYGEQFNAMHVNQTLTGVAFGHSQEDA